ncbi:hypothetical protein [Streptomyces sp. AHA2]|uniref:hypothetical protein n=1 Tax=Streptomyces sp. AHA2 TaxID=3064526 RepID=UPI002FE2BC83
MTERERQELQRATAQKIVDALPAWDGQSPSVWVLIVDPDTMRPYTRWRTSATAVSAPKPARVRHLHAVRDVS